jgi:hypothetical protein
MSIQVYATLLVTFLVAKPLAAQPIPFDICAESRTWTRPTPEVQAKIWNDGRYRDLGPRAYAWTHNFIFIGDPRSASIPYHLMNESGLWTAAPGTFGKCYSDEYQRRSGYEWIEVWSLLHRAREVRRDANTYTIIVEPTTKGFQFVFIRRLNPSVVLRFVTPDGKELEKWDESDPPDRVQQMVLPDAVIRAPNGEAIRK